MTQVCTLTLTDVTSIGAYGFCGCKNLTTLTAPKLETVVEGAFSGCALSVIDLPALTTMGATAFSNMENIKKINLPSVTEISVWAFDNCTFADDAQIILTGLNADGTFNDYWGLSTYTDFFSDGSTKNVNLTLSSALASQVNGSVWTVPRKSGASYVPVYTFKTITLVDNSAE